MVTNDPLKLALLSMTEPAVLITWLTDPAWSALPGLQAVVTELGVIRTPLSSPVRMACRPSLAPQRYAVDPDGQRIRVDGSRPGEIVTIEILFTPERRRGPRSSAWIIGGKGAGCTGWPARSSPRLPPGCSAPLPDLIVARAGGAPASIEQATTNPSGDWAEGLRALNAVELHR